MTGPYGASPAGNSDYLWIQVNPSLNRDDDLQYFVNIQNGTRVYGKTSGTFSDHIHLYTLAGNDSTYNMDPVTGQVSKNGNPIGLISQIGTSIAALVFPPAASAFSAVNAGVQGATQTGQGSAWYQAAPTSATSSATGGSIFGLNQNTILLIAAVVAIVLVTSR